MVGCLDHRGCILVCMGRLLRDAPGRRAADEDTPRCQLVLDAASVKAPDGLAAAHAAAGTVAGRTVRQPHALCGAGEDI